jgi:LCP family protein required for cell wall assembly
MKKHVRKLGRLAVLALVLAVVGLTVPDSTVRPAEFALVKVGTAQAVDSGGKDMIWMLLVGSDARPGENMTRSRGDALQLVGINTKTGAAASIGIPRDSWVSIPGYGYNKINASMVFGGPRLLGQTVGNLVGVQPQYVMVTRFQSFINMVNSIGGIDVYNPTPFSDDVLHRDPFPKGKIHLKGYSAMAFSRIRHSLPGGDFDRSANQQRTMKGIVTKIGQRAGQPGFLARGVATVMKNLDTNLGPGELYRLAEVAAHVDPHKITSCVVQGSIGDIGGASVVRPYVSAARGYGNDARRDGTLKHC